MNEMTADEEQLQAIRKTQDDLYSKACREVERLRAKVERARQFELGVYEALSQPPFTEKVQGRAGSLVNDVVMHGGIEHHERSTGDCALCSSLAEMRAHNALTEEKE